MPSAVDDASGSTQREADRSLVALDHNRLARRIRRYRAGSGGCGCLRCRCWLCVSCCLLCRCRTRLGERQRGGQRAGESDHYSFHYMPPLLIITSSPLVRSHKVPWPLPSAAVKSLTVTGTEVFDRIHSSFCRASTKPADSALEPSAPSLGIYFA